MTAAPGAETETCFAAGSLLHGLDETSVLRMGAELAKATWNGTAQCGGEEKFVASKLRKISGVPVRPFEGHMPAWVGNAEDLGTEQRNQREGKLVKETRPSAAALPPPIGSYLLLLISGVRLGLHRHLVIFGDGPDETQLLQHAATAAPSGSQPTAHDSPYFSATVPSSLLHHFRSEEALAEPRRPMLTRRLRMRQRGGVASVTKPRGGLCLSQIPLSWCSEGRGHVAECEGRESLRRCVDKLCMCIFVYIKLWKILQ